MQTDLHAIDIHTHVVPEKFPAYTGVHRNTPWPSMQPAQPCHCNVIIEGLGLDIASPDEAREILQLKGGDKVNF